MERKYAKYVYVVDVDAYKIVDTADNEKSLLKRIEGKKKPYPENMIVLKADISSPLTNLKTDELIGYDNIQNALTAAIVCGVSATDAIDKLAEAGAVQVVTL